MESVIIWDHAINSDSPSMFAQSAMLLIEMMMFMLDEDPVYTTVYRLYITVIFTARYGLLITVNYYLLSFILWLFLTSL